MRNVLKYPGSKWKIADKIISLIPEHHTYVEPFFGSGAVFFKKQPSDIETINDLDNDVVNLFRCIREDSERLARIIMTIPYSRQEYENQFSENIGDIQTEPYERAVSFLIKCWQGYGFRTNGYKSGWKNDVQGSKAKIMISGHESEMYNDYLKGWNKAYFTSCSEHGGSRTEVVWMNYDL